MKKQILIIGFLSCLLILLNGCGGKNKAIQIKGSDTMVNLGQAWAEEFMKEHPTLAVAVTGGGSGIGIASLLSGTTDIAQSSRNMEKKELVLAQKKGIAPKEIFVGFDGVTLVVNPANPVSKITLQQLSDIFTGQIKDWAQLGGKPGTIVALSRDRSSGTHAFFLEHVVKMGDKKNLDEFAPTVLMLPSSQAIVEEVSSNPSAIGYIGLGYLTAKQKALAVSAKAGSPYVAPTVATVASKQYPVARSLQFYVNGEPSGEVKTFIDFVLSPAGQKVVEKMDFVPLKK